MKQKVITERLQQIADWTSENNQGTNRLKREDLSTRLLELEKMVGEPLPEAFKEIYRVFNGEEGQQNGTFYGNRFCQLTKSKRSWISL